MKLLAQLEVAEWQQNLGDVPEAYVREAIGTTSESTALSNIPNGLKELGFGRQANYMSSFDVEVIQSSFESGASITASVRAGASPMQLLMKQFRVVEYSSKILGLLVGDGLTQHQWKV